MADRRTALAEAVAVVAGGAALPPSLATAALREVMDGEAPSAQVGALLAMLHLRGETADEVAAFAGCMRERAIRVDAPEGAIDLCGTGADAAGTFNVSTVTSFVVAGAGVPVAKHGNRAVTSRCGSADLVEALGVPLEVGPDVVARSIRETGFGFIFAPAYHPALRHAMPVRRELPIRTVFNLLGPLASPALVRRQLLGVSDARLLPLLAGALSRLGVERAMVVHAADGLDELSLAGPNRALLVEGDDIVELAIDAADHGLARAPAAALAGGDAARNREIALAVLSGEPGPARDVVLLNAGAALLVAGRVATVDDGIEAAAAAIDEGRAAAVLDRVAATSA
ncbi:MAG TPA: anthranilate phosphoribosyltransferase [Candidatus Binatia bacterium]|nr:anthranilate phosphoribosyltransferase [Candidatus Binatia bacterium]